MSKRVISIVTALAFAAVLPVVAGPAHAGSATIPSAAAAANPAPEPLTGPSITGIAQVKQTLAAVGATWPLPGSSTFTWSVEGGPEGSGVGQGETYLVQPADVGHEVTLTETFSSPGYENATTTATSATIVAAFPAPEPLTDPSITGTTQVGQTLTAHAAEWPVDGDSSFAWSGADQASGGPTYLVRPADLGHQVTLTETFSSPGYENPVVTVTSATITNGTAPQTQANVSIFGTAQVGQLLAARHGTWSIAEGQSTFAWTVGGTPVGTGTTYKVTPADLGKPITVTETFTSPGYDVATGAVDSAAVVPGPAPTSTVQPWVTGAIRVGSTLKVVPATWSAAGTSTLAWSVGGKTVSTGTSYVVTAADIGEPLVFTETITVAGYDPGTARTQPEAVAKAKVDLTVKRGKAKKGKKSKVLVTAKSGRLTVPGKVRLNYAGKKVRSGMLKNGKLTVRLPAKHKGDYWLTVSYTGADAFAKAGKTVKVKVR